MGFELPRGGWKTAVVASALGVAVASAAATVGATFARKVVTPERAPEELATVTGIELIDGTTVAWLRGPDVALPGKYSFLFDGEAGHARLGPVTHSRRGEVGRELVTVDRGQIAAGSRGRMTGWWFTDPEELGYRTERITYPTELGDAEAWLIHPRRMRKHRWSVHVHGRGARPEETLRGVAPLLRAGATCLIISYRNDAGAPASGTGRYGLGISEARDVDAAISEVLRRGARRVTLVGWSMGGTAALLVAARSEHAGVIDGVILDSPAVDWPALLAHQAKLRRLPGLVTRFGLGLVDRGLTRSEETLGTRLAGLTPAAFAPDLNVPVLIHASKADTFVPCSGAQRLAELRPDLVDLRLATRGEHVKIWNVDPEAWESATQHFAATLPTPAFRG